MTFKSPEVIYLIDTGDGVAWCGDPDPTGYGECDDAVKYVRGDAYEALQAAHEEELFCVRQTRDTHFGEMMRAIEQVDAMKAECEELRTALAESRANDLTAMGYLNQVRELVGGDDFTDMVRRCEKLRKDAEFGRSVLAKREPGKSYGCHCDLEEGMEPDGCVIDFGERHNCIYAKDISVKEQCDYWRVIVRNAAIREEHNP